MYVCMDMYTFFSWDPCSNLVRFTEQLQAPFYCWSIWPGYLHICGQVTHHTRRPDEGAREGWDPSHVLFTKLSVCGDTQAQRVCLFQFAQRHRLAVALYLDLGGIKQLTPGPLRNQRPLFLSLSLLIELLLSLYFSIIHWNRLSGIVFVLFFSPGIVNTDKKPLFSEHLQA